jgi:hypothetical protein
MFKAEQPKTGSAPRLGARAAAELIVAGGTHRVAEGHQRSEVAVRDAEATARSSGRACPCSRHPEEIAWPVIFVASDQAIFMTGETVYVSGGPRVSNRED